MSDLYNGTCHADPGAALSRELLTASCNPGHARAVCPRAAQSEADSIRLMVRSDDKISIEIAWATERNHHPVAVGSIRVPRNHVPATSPLEHQANACAAAYIRHTGN
jgi:hypothetical protein